MSDYDKPLGVPSAAPARRPFGRRAGMVLAVLILAAAGFLTIWSIIGSDTRERTVVAIVDEPQPSKTPAQTASPEASDPATERPLSPLLPIDGEPSPAPAAPERTTVPPVFNPAPAPVTRRSPGLPDPDLVEESEFGALPKVSETGLRPLDRYAQPAARSGANRIAIVVGGLGLSQTGTQAAIRKLPSDVTLAFSPFGNSLQRWAQMARKEGHEVALQLPMEPLGYPAVSPGKQTLAADAGKGENLRRLRWSLGRMTNYPLVINYLGAGVLPKDEIMRPLLKELEARGLGFVDDGSVPASLGTSLARDLRLPHAQGNIELDRARDEQQLRRSLKTLEAVSRDRGYAIATASAFPKSVEIIAEWAEGAAARGIVIVPLSNLIKDYSR